jgi:hypothetical protein
MCAYPRGCWKTQNAQPDLLYREEAVGDEPLEAWHADLLQERVKVLALRQLKVTWKNLRN